MFPATLYKQSDKDSTMIITTLGIDKKEDKLSISALAVIPNSSQEISAKLEVFEGVGTSIDEALQKISQNT
jgi:succinyl-CoA synthetase alpha subunit